IGALHAGVIGKAHRRLELGAVLADALGDRALDLRIGPVADALGLARRDVARHRHAPRPLELKSALAEIADEILALLPERRVAFHAMRDGGEIEAALDLVEHGGRR